MPANSTSRPAPGLPTFREFVRFLLGGAVDGDVHVMGFQKKCDVCNLPYNFIGKVENMNVDDRYVLDAIRIADKTVRGGKYVQELR